MAFTDSNKYKKLVELSERKHPSHKHYKLITGISEYDDSIADYIIDEIKFSPNVSQSEFNLNRKITRDPKIFNQQKETAEREEREIFIDYLKSQLNSKEENTRKIALITLSDMGIELKEINK